MGILDRVLLGGAHPDPADRARREDVFVVAVQCTQAGEHLLLRLDGHRPDGRVAATTSRSPRCSRASATTSCSTSAASAARELLGELPHRPRRRRRAGRRRAPRTRAPRRRWVASCDASDIRELLYRNYENPRWDEVAERCLTCGNCTMVCPTCFCTTVEDVTDLAGEHVERHQRWDSCFTIDYSHIHGGTVRSSTRSRYRQWMTHKLATWIDQFGSSGCVGCGRCITWCPVGIDITEEARAIRRERRRVAIVRTLEELIAAAPAVRRARRRRSSR